MPLVSGFFVWTRREYLQKREPSIIGAFFLLPGALLYGLSFLWEIRVFGVLSLIIVLTGLVFSFFGTRTARAMLFPLVYLVFMIPLPFISNLAYRLQEISIYSSSRLLDALGLPVASAGSEIYLENTTFTIGLPCSGINTFVALLALAAVYAQYTVDGVTKDAGVAGMRPLENGLQLLWGYAPENIDPIPSDAKELAFTITKIGDWQGPWEFRIPLE